MEIEVTEISSDEYDAGRCMGNITELDDLRKEFPTNLEAMKLVIAKVIMSRTTKYDDLVLRAIKELKAKFGFEMTYQYVRYLVLSELSNHDKAIDNLFSSYGRHKASPFMRRFNGILKRNNIGNKVRLGYYKSKGAPGFSGVLTKKVINHLDFRKPYSQPLVTPALLLHNLIYIMDSKKSNDPTEEVETNEIENLEDNADEVLYEVE